MKLSGKILTMGIFKSVKTLIRRSVGQSSGCSPSRDFFSLSVASPPSIQASYVCRRFLFRSRVLYPAAGPLFLSNPPWMLSQSATPRLLRSEVVLKLLKLRALNLLHRPALLCSSDRDDRRLYRESSVDELGRGVVDAGINRSYLNVPNFISFARMLSVAEIRKWPFLTQAEFYSLSYEAFIVKLKDEHSYDRTLMFLPDERKLLLPDVFMGLYYVYLTNERFCRMILNDMFTYSFVGLAISGASDWLDGYVARKMKINSVLGSYLDPLADKVLIGCVVLAVVDKNLLHPGLVALVVLRDFALVGGAVYIRCRSLGRKWSSWNEFFNLNGSHAQKVEPLMISKVNTVFQLALVAAALLQPGFGNEETGLYINYLSWLVASTTIGSTAAYGVQHWRTRAALMKT